MILFKENSNINLKKVTTVLGNTEYRRNCIKIKNKFYTKNLECVEINDKWVIKTDDIVFDHEKQLYTYKNGLLYGVINKDLELGHFSNSKSSLNFNIWYYDEVKHYRYPVHKFEYVEHLNFIKNSDDLRVCKSPDLNYLEQFQFKDQGYNMEQCSDYPKIQMYYNSVDLKIDNSVRRFKNILGDTTFGLEVETRKGILPEFFRYRYGIIICKDGSIDYSPEYTTVPYSGEKGLQSMKELFKYLSIFTSADHSCSYHIHFGNLRKDREYLLAVYRLFCFIQNELFFMFPYYKRNFKIAKHKNYNQFLINLISTYDNTKGTYKEYINSEYCMLYQYLNDNVPPDTVFNKKNKNHVAGEFKWNCQRRYYALNFINALFSSRETLEFRLSSSTVNFTKASNWFVICLAILKYADKFSSKILTQPNLSIDLKEVLSILPNKSNFPMADYLYQYYLERVERQRQSQMNDPFCGFELMEDKTNYSFEKFGIKTLF